MNWNRHFIAVLLLTAGVAQGQSSITSETFKLRHIGPYYLTDKLKGDSITNKRLIKQISISFPNNSVTVSGTERGMKVFKEDLANLDAGPNVYCVNMRLERFHMDAGGEQTESTVFSASPSILATGRDVVPTPTEIAAPNGYSISVTLRYNADGSVTLTSAIKELGADGEILSTGKSVRNVQVGETSRTVGMTEENDADLRRLVHRGEIAKDHGAYSCYYLSVQLVPGNEQSIAWEAGQPTGPKSSTNPDALLPNAGSSTKVTNIHLHYIYPDDAVYALRSQHGIAAFTLDFVRNSLAVQANEETLQRCVAAVRLADVRRRYYFVSLRLVRYHIDTSGKRTETVVMTPGLDAYNNYHATYPEFMQPRRNDFTVELTITPNRDRTLTLASEVSELDLDGEVVSSGKNTRIVNVGRTVRAVGMTKSKDLRVRKAVHQGDMPVDLGEYSGYYLDMKVATRAAPGDWPYPEGNSQHA